MSNKLKYRLEKHWDIEYAEYHYSLSTGYPHRKRAREDNCYKHGSLSVGDRAGFTYSDTEVIWGELATGDREWAQRTAKHFGIPMPEED